MSEVKPLIVKRLRNLHELATSDYPDLRSRLKAYLQEGCAMFSMQVGVVKKVDGSLCYVHERRGRQSALSGLDWSKARMPDRDNACSQIGTDAVGNAAAEDADAGPIVMPWDVEIPAYIRTALVVDGSYAGTLFFASDSPRSSVWLDADRETIELMADGISRSLEAEQAQAQQRRADEALQDSQALLTSVLENSTDGILALEPVRDGREAVKDFRGLFANARAAEILGYSENELVGNRAAAMIPQARRKGFFKPCVQVLESGEPYHNEVHYDGKRFQGWFQVTIVPFGNGIAVTLRDVTADKEVEQALRRSEERYRLLAENATDLIARIHPEHGYTYVSPASRSVLGYSPNELVEREGEEYIHPDDRMRVQASFERVLATGEPVRCTYRHRRREGQYVWVESIARCVQHADDEGSEEIIAVTRDVTERVKAEEALRHTNKQLKQRNQALKGFAYVASHDLQEPLRKVRAFTSLLDDEYSDAVDEMGQQYMDRIRDAATRMSSLITDLLEFSRLSTEEHPLEEVNLVEVVQRVADDLEIAIEESQASIEIDELPTLWADRTQMRQLFQNLISNAIKFAREGAPPVVQIRTEYPSQDAEKKEHAQCRILIEDNGIGFDEKYLDRIFSPFKRLHGRSTYSGTGMGLAISKRIADRHDGTLTASSEQGCGSTFVVTLPLHRSSNTPQSDEKE